MRLITAALSAKEPFAWSDADDRRSFVALDVLEERETSGAVRFAQVGLWSSELRERVLEVALVEGGPQANLPLTVGGFALLRATAPAPESGETGPMDFIGCRAGLWKSGVDL